MKYFILGAISSLFFIWANIVIWGGEYFDEKCVKGRLKVQHIKAIEASGWTKNLPKVNDRIVARECSEFLRKIHFRDIK